MLKRIPPRYQNFFLIALVFLVANLLVRIGLMVFEQDWSAEWSAFSPLTLLRIVGVGLMYDLAALSWVLVPFGLLALLFSNGPIGRRLYAPVHQLLLFAALFGMLFVATSEFIFWNEFSSRFNFIAVDYLIYTREVIGNIRESYPVGWIFAGFGLLACLLIWWLWPRTWRNAQGEAGAWPRRLLFSAILACFPAVSWFAVNETSRDHVVAAAHREFMGNGYYDFMHAFWANDLDYRSFYPTLPGDQAVKLLRAQALQANPGAQLLDGTAPTARKVEGRSATRKLNVVMVTIESLGSDSVAAFSGKKTGLTPNLDQLARESLKFTKLYATGLRTVRGLEAVTLSMPPTPGHALPMRKDNKGFQTLGGVLRANGYDALYMYGGYAYFDNMRDFFTGNGYEVLDRTDIQKENISHENIWGVADEDVFNHVLKELDRRSATGKPQFVHVMTTSNHRPFTYPNNRIDIPSGQGRDGAVKYTDWAIGDFLTKARQRPWFGDTMFVFLADHSSHGRGKTALPPEHYEIPMWIYSPKHIQAATIDWLASQIDVAPTILARLGIAYESHFFGQDILVEGKNVQRAFMSNYLTVGYLENDSVVELMPKRRQRVMDFTSGQARSADPAANRALVNKAIAYYQTATDVQRGRLLR